MSEEQKKKFKLWGGLSLSGVVAVFTFVFAYVERGDDRIRAEVKAYVDVKDRAVVKRLDQMHETLIRIDERVYKLNEKND